MSATTLITLLAPAGITSIKTRNGNSYTPNQLGLVQVYAIDVDDLLRAGFIFAGSQLSDALASIQFVDDFFGDTLASLYRLAKGSDGACVDWAILAGVGGLIAATTGAGAGGSMAVNGVQIDDGELNWSGANGGLSIQARVKASAITNVAFFLGFTDQVSALEMPFTLSAGSLTSNATDGFGILFDSRATTPNWKAVGVANDVDATVQDLGLAPVADTFEVFGAQLSAAGVATFTRNGQVIGSAMTAACRASVALTPVIAGFATAAASRVFTADYLALSANRGS